MEKSEPRIFVGSDELDPKETDRVLGLLTRYDGIEVISRVAYGTEPDELGPNPYGAPEDI